MHILVNHKITSLLARIGVFLDILLSLNLLIVKISDNAIDVTFTTIGAFLYLRLMIKCLEFKKKKGKNFN